MRFLYLNIKLIQKLNYSFNVYIILAFLSVSAKISYSQIQFLPKISDTIKIKEVIVSEKRDLLKVGGKIILIDSAKIAEQDLLLSELLKKNSSVYIKDYGTAGLSTATFRGTSANHTAVLWNNINLNSSMNGQIDFNNIPTSFIDNIDIAHGNSGIYNSAGSFGGNIMLKNKPDWDNKKTLFFRQTVGDFRRYISSANFSLGNNNFQSETKFQYIDFKNNFKYLNIAKNDNPTETLNHANVNIISLMQNIYFKHKKNIFSLNMWGIKSDKEIPSILTVAKNSEYIYNDGIRGVFEWQYNELNYKVSFKSGFVYDKMNYVDTISKIDALHKSYTSRNIIEYNYIGIKKINFNAKFSYDKDIIVSTSYDGKKQNNTFNLIGLLKYKITKKIDASVIVSKINSYDKFTPFLPAISFKYNVIENKLSVFANASQNYRIPTMNEKYWDIVGNIDLKPEKSNLYEAGAIMQYGLFKNKINIEHSVTGYYNDCEDFIVWLPDSVNSFLYRPSNFRDVEIQGLEFSSKLHSKIKKIDINIWANYDYCKSINKSKISENDNSYNKQLIYVPNNTFKSGLEISNNKWGVGIEHFIIGKRYITTDNNWYLPMYYLTDLSVSRKIKLKRDEINIRLNVNNIFDIQYQAVAWRPMPGVNCLFSLSYKFKK